MRKPEYKEQGETFVLKRTTPNNRKGVEEYFASMDEDERVRLKIIGDLAEKSGAGENITLEDLPPGKDDYKMYFDLFLLVTDGPHEKLDFDDFDIKLGEQAVMDFLPYAVKTALSRTGFLPSP